MPPKAAPKMGACPRPRSPNFTGVAINGGRSVRNNDMNFLPVGFIYPSLCLYGKRLSLDEKGVNRLYACMRV
jgi:hypothetical protein